MTKSKTSIEQQKQQIRDRATQDLEFFIRLVHPGRLLGSCHLDVISWMTSQDASSHQLILLPRDHQKSALIAFRVAWEITRNPAIRILYVSATSTLAVKQLDFIKQILTSDTYMFYWPEMVRPDKGMRTKWTESEIAVDHPYRKEEAVRDSTVFTAGLTTIVTGLHSDIIVLDDVVVAANAKDKASRAEVSRQCGYLTSVVGTDGRIWVTGTHYDPDDYYQELKEIVVDQYDENGNVTHRPPLYSIYQKEVEDKGDGTGNFLWPRQRRSDGKFFGFNREILAVKRASYKNYSEFRAQYYNDPSAIGGSSFDRSNFQYFERSNVNAFNGHTYYKDNRLNVFAAMDFAYSTRDKADWTCIVVIGVDCFNNIFVLDIDRFKTGKISDYYSHLVSLHSKWGFRKLNAEITAAQKVIVRDLKDNYIRPNGLLLSIIENRPTTDKAIRIESVLEPRYNNQQIFHYRGGNCELLEDELLSAKPAHDDIKDALACAIGISVAPSQGFISNVKNKNSLTNNLNTKFNARFGGYG